MRVKIRGTGEIRDLELLYLREHIAVYKTNMLTGKKAQAYYDLSLIIHGGMSQCPLTLKGIMKRCEKCVDFNYCVYRFLGKVVK